MSTTQVLLSEMYRRDLTRLSQEIERFPAEEMLWQMLPGIANSAGNLAMHLEGNLREYIGRQIGGLAYTRNRPLEFAGKGVPKHEILRRIAELSELIPSIITAIPAAELEKDYPEIVLGKPLTVYAFLIHLHGHFNWHLGQIDYLRRVLTGESALKLASL